MIEIEFSSLFITLKHPRCSIFPIQQEFILTQMDQFHQLICMSLRSWNFCLNWLSGIDLAKRIVDRDVILWYSSKG